MMAVVTALFHEVLACVAEVGLTAQSVWAGAQAAAPAASAASAQSPHALDSWGELLWGTGMVAISLLLVWPLAWLLGYAKQRLLDALSRAANRHARRIKVAGVSIFNGESLINAVRLVVRLVFAVLWLVLIYQWLSLALRQFQATRAWGEMLQKLMLDTLLPLASSAASAIPNLLVAGLILTAAHYLLGTLKPIFDRAEAGGVDLGWLDADTARPTRRLISIGIWTFAIAMAYPYLPGAQTEAFKGLSLLLGLMASLGASSVVGQAASGLILMYTRTIRLGEFVRVGEYEGTITELGTFSTRMRTGQGEELILPNSLIASSVTRNYSRAVQGEGFVIDTTVTIGYDTPWRQVEALLKLAASRTPGVLSEPAPRVFQTRLSDFYAEYRLVAQARPTEPGPRAQIISELHGRIQDTFNEYGVQIMSPHYLGDPADAKLVPRARWFDAPARPEAGAEFPAPPHAQHTVSSAGPPTVPPTAASGQN
jgi:small-conductance mechanosensitive channel